MEGITTHACPAFQTFHNACSGLQVLPCIFRDSNTPPMGLPVVVLITLHQLVLHKLVDILYYLSQCTLLILYMHIHFYL